MKSKKVGGLLASLSVFVLFSCSKVPEVSTLPINGVSNTGAQSGGTVLDEGSGPVTGRGICWSIYPGPNVNNSVTYDGSGAGSYSSSLAGLSPNTTYYVRAYANNKAGTGYGEELSFTTASAPFPVSYNGTTLYVHPTNNAASFAWADENVNTGATSITDGEQNTAILATYISSNAAKICANLNAYGYDDWYLPSKDELVNIAIAIGNNGSFNTSAGSWYWSSTQSDANSAWAVDFYTGGNGHVTFKSGQYPCRCIRKD